MLPDFVKFPYTPYTPYTPYCWVSFSIPMSARVCSQSMLGIVFDTRVCIGAFFEFWVSFSIPIEGVKGS